MEVSYKTLILDILDEISDEEQLRLIYIYIKEKTD